MTFGIRILCLLLTTVGLVNAQVLELDDSAKSQRFSINQDWQYHQGKVPTDPARLEWNTHGWQQVNLPHTYKLTSINLDDSEDDKSQPTFHRDVSWYQKTLFIESTSKQKVYLEFEGAHQKTRLWVNGQYVSEHVIGAYTPFHFDITDAINPGQSNVITLQLDNRADKHIPPDGHTMDYVLFGGLYRDVFLNIVEPVHFTLDWESATAGIFVTTPSVSQADATVTVRSEIRNSDEEPQRVTVRTFIANAQNKIVKRRSSEHKLAPGSTALIKHTTGIDKDLRLWSPDTPYLYSVISQIVDAQGQVLQTKVNPLGIRKFELVQGKGLLLNGKPIEIIGANRHQHFPYIGDAVPNNLHRLDAIKFKQSGMNLVRLAHYPHDNAFIEACDELGLIVVEEPPTWIGIGDQIWMNRLEEATRRMIRNHRNHPSILGWGAGINHRGTIKQLHYAAKEEDPTRISMNNGTLWTGEQHSGITDLYAVMDYRGAVRQPHDLLFAMEHTGSPDSLALQQIVSRYKGDPNLIGLASWSAHDSQSFIKRDEQYPNLSVWKAASWDAFRQPKPNYYWYQSELSNEPMVHIPDSRGQFENEVQVFTNADEVELVHQGKSLGHFSPQQDDNTQYLRSPSIRVPYEWREGEMKAIARQNGEVVAQHSRVKGNIARRLTLQFDSQGFDGQADGSSILLATAVLTDEQGFPVDEDTPPVSFSLQGDGQIVGDAKIGANPVTWRNGIAPVLVRVGTTDSILTLTASTDGLEPASATIAIRKPEHSVSEESREVVYDPLYLAVDLGNHEQHPQEDFALWSHESGPHKVEFAATNGQTVGAEITNKSRSLEWTHTWGVPGDLSFMIEDGVSSPDGSIITLRLTQLPAGTYQFHTWHHLLTSEPSEVSPLDFRIEGASNVQLPSDYLPTFGKKIAITEAGGGAAGDGGSNKGAAGFARHQFELKQAGDIQLTIQPNEAGKAFRLNGFELIQQL